MALQYLRSLVFNAQMYVAMLVVAIVYLPMALFSRDWAIYAAQAHCRWVIWTAGWMVGLKTEVRGPLPVGPALICAKHMSFYDIIVIFAHCQLPRFIMKRELIYAPILGQYALRMGCVPVRRGKGSVAVAEMVREVTKGLERPGQLIIYPQGTRVAPGVSLPYKSGAGILYETMGVPSVPVATNIGVFWPRHGVLRKPGVAVVEFLAPIPAGLPREEFMARMSQAIETRSDALMAEAGFVPPAGNGAAG